MTINALKWTSLGTNYLPVVWLQNIFLYYELHSLVARQETLLFELEVLSRVVNKIGAIQRAGSDPLVKFLCHVYL